MIVANQLVPLIQASGLKSRTIVQSFYPPALTYVRSLDPTISTQLLTIGSLTPYLVYSATGPDILSPSSTNPDLTAQTVQAAHAAGKKVIPYTPDTAADLTTTGNKGVDGEITNFPACLLRLEGRPFPAQLLPAEAVAAGATASPVCQAEPAPTPTVPEAPYVGLLAVPALATLWIWARRSRRGRTVATITS